MKRLVLITLFNLFFIVGYGQVLSWGKAYGSTGNDYASASCVDQYGNVYIVGTFQGTVDFNPGAGVNNLTAAGGEDGFIQKLDANGNFVFVYHISGTGTERCKSVAVAPNGLIYACGEYSGSVDFNTGVGTAIVNSLGLLDAFTISLNSDATFGTILVFGAGGNDSANTVACNNGAVVIGGVFQNTVDFNVGSGVNSLTASGTSGFLARYTGGTYSWAYVSGASVNGTAMTSTGNIYSTGSFTGTFDFDFSGGVNNLVSAGGNDAFIQVVSPTGTPGLAKSFGGAGSDTGISIKFDAASNMYVSGYFNGTADFDPSAGTSNLVSAGGNDAYVSKFSNTGALVWAKGFGGTGDDRATSVDFDQLSYVYTSGYFNGTVDFDPSAGTTSLTSAGGTDGYVSKFTPAGLFQWTQPISSTLDDAITGLTTSVTPSIYLSGYHTATIDVDPTVGVTSFTSAGLRDAYVAKWEPCATMPSIANTTTSTSSTICEGTSAVLSAAGSGTVSWYSAANGGTYLGSGTTFTTPILNVSTSYYAQDSTCIPSTRTQVLVNVQSAITDQVISASASTICQGTSATVSTASSQVGKQYFLRDNSNNSIIAGPVAGNGSSLNFSTGPINSSTTYNVLASSQATNFALDLDGTNDYVNLGTNNRNITNAITVSAKVKTSITGASQFIVDKYLSAGIGYYLLITATGQATFQGRDVTGSIKTSGNSTTIVADNQWHEITGVVRNTGWEIWVDGVLENSGAYTLGTTGLGTTAGLLVGQFNSTYTAADIDHVAIWNAALSPATIASNVVNCLSGGEANLVGYFNFNEGTGTTVTDLSPLALSGALTNMTAPACWISGSTTACPTGCQLQMSNTVTISIDPAPAQPTISASGTTTLCSGGSVTLTSSAGTSYLWSTGATTSSIVVSTAGTYTVQVTNAAGCQSVASAGTTVIAGTPPAQPTVSAGGATTFCAGGSVTLTASAGTTYLWSNGATTASISPTTSGTYTVQVTNASGCQSVASAGTIVTVNTAPAQPTISAGGTTTFCTGGSVTLTASAGTSYLWSTGATTAAISPTTAGTYTVQVTNAAGCQSVASTGTTVTVNTLPTQPTISAGGSTTFCTGGSVTLTASTGTSYLWSTGATTAAITPSTAGTYTVQVTNASGCQSIASAGTTVTVNALPTQPTITAGGATTFCTGGSVTLNASAGTSYLWSTGATTAAISPTTSGTYTVQVTNAQGCQSVASAGTVVTVNTLPTQPTITAGGPTTFCSGGSVTLTASAGSSYLWSDGSMSPSINVSSTSTYTVQVTNAAGCQSVASASTVVTVNTLPNAPIISPNAATTFCAGGTVNLASSAGITYLWSNGSTAPSIDVTSSGTFTVQITGPTGCQSPASAPTTVTVNAVPVITQGTVANPTSCTIDNGSIQVNGTATGTLSWSGTSSGSLTGVTLPTTISSLGDGSYSVTFTNTTSCISNTLNVSLSAPAAPATPTINAGGPTTFCEGGSVTLTASTGTSYVWSNGATTASIVASLDGNYTVSITDASGCSSASSTATTVTILDLPIISTGALTNPSSCTVSDGSIEVVGTETGNLNWTGTSVGSLTGVSLPTTVGSLANGNYSFTFTSSTGCVSLPITGTLTLPSAPPAPSITAGGSTTLCEGDMVTLMASNGDSYLWSNGETTQSIDVDLAGTYTVSITDLSGCTSPSSSGTTVVVNAIPVATTSLSGITITATTAGASYQWIDCGNSNQSIAGATSQSFTPTVNGTYAVIVTENNCSDTSTCTAITSVGLDDHSSLVEMRLQPNPSFKEVTIVTNAVIEKVEIFTMAGELVQLEFTHAFSVEDLSRGIYLVKVISSQGMSTLRLIKE